MQNAVDQPRTPRHRSLAHTALAGAVTVLLVAALVAGCSDHGHHNDTFVAADPVEFIWEGSFDNYYNEEVYYWNTIYDAAVVELDAYDFRGHLILDIYDATDELIYSHEFIGHGGELFQIDHTDIGFSGEWVIVITSTDVDGFLTLYVY